MFEEINSNCLYKNIPVRVNGNKHDTAVCVNSFIPNKSDFQIMQNSRLVQIRQAAI